MPISPSAIRRLAATVVELDALADTVRPAAEDHYLAAVRRDAFVLFLVGGIVIGRIGLELGGAGVNEFVGRYDADFLPQFTHGRVRLFSAAHRAARPKTPCPSLS